MKSIIMSNGIFEGHQVCFDDKTISISLSSGNALSLVHKEWKIPFERQTSFEKNNTLVIVAASFVSRKLIAAILKEIDLKEKYNKLDFRGVQIVAKNNFYALPIKFFRNKWASKTFLTMFENLGNVEKEKLSNESVKDFDKLFSLCKSEFENEAKKCQIEIKEKSL